MGWLQLRRWLSFLPAAFVVYILLHYLVYQPDLTGPHAAVLVSSGRNTSIVSVAGGRSLQSGPRVLPHLPHQQGGAAGYVLSEDGSNLPRDAATQQLPTSDEPQATSVVAAASPADGSHPQPEPLNDTAVPQGSAGTPEVDPPSLVRFDSVSQALEGDQTPSDANSASLRSGGGGLIGSGSSDTGFALSDSGSRAPDISSAPQDVEAPSFLGRPDTNRISSAKPSGERHLEPSVPPASLIAPLVPFQASTKQSIPQRAPIVSGGNAKRELSKGQPFHPAPSHNNLPSYEAAAAPPYDPKAPQYDKLNYGHPYQGNPLGYSLEYPVYDSYKQQPYVPEVAAQRVLYAHSHAMAQMGGLPPPGNNDLSPVFDPFASYPDGHDLTMGEGPSSLVASLGHPGSIIVSGKEQPPAAAASSIAQASPERPQPQGHSEVRVSSTVRAVTSSLSSSSSSATGKSGAIPPVAAAVLAAAQNQPKPPPGVVVVQGTGSMPQPRKTVTKKTTVVKKSNVATSTGLAINALKGRTKVGAKYESGFSVPHEELCINNGRDLKVLVLITTAPDHEKHRTAVRQTWGHFAVRKDVITAFVVGRTSNPNIQNNLDRENELYGDIIQTNFIDHYSNLTLKTISMFEWVKTYCSESHFVLKTDDDMFINMPLLLTFIESKLNDRRVMYGRLAKGWKPVRNKKSKYYIDTNTYSKSKYPDFLTGPAYLFTNDVVDDIYQKALNTTFFVLEDVLLTGIVGESLRIRRVGDSRFRNEKIKLTDTCSLMKTISIHMVKYEEQFDIYKRTLDGKAKCKAG